MTDFLNTAWDLRVFIGIAVVIMLALSWIERADASR